MELHCLMVYQRVPKIICTERKPEINQEDSLYIYTFWLLLWRPGIGHRSLHHAVSQIFQCASLTASIGSYVYSCGDTSTARWGNLVSAEAPVPFGVKLEEFDTKPTKVTKMFLNHCSGWIPDLLPPPPDRKNPLNFEHLGAQSLWDTAVHTGTQILTQWC